MTAYRVCFWVPGEAKPESKRQRFFRDKAGHTHVGPRTDEPDRKDWKGRVYVCAKQSCPEPMHGPLSLTLVFVRRSPTGTNKKPTEKRPWPWAWLTKPDCDNLAKPVKDALTGVAWVDDAQVVREEVVKHQGPGEAPGVWVLVEEAFEATVLLVRELCIDALGRAVSSPQAPNPRNSPATQQGPIMAQHGALPAEVGPCETCGNAKCRFRDSPGVRGCGEWTAR